MYPSFAIYKWGKTGYTLHGHVIVMTTKRSEQRWGGPHSRVVKTANSISLARLIIR